VLAQAETFDGVHADVTVHPRRPQLALERLADLLRAPLLAVAALADEDVRFVVPDLRVRLLAVQDLCGGGFTAGFLFFPGYGSPRFQARKRADYQLPE